MLKLLQHCLCLNFLHCYFNNPIKLYIYIFRSVSVKTLDLTKIFCIYSIPCIISSRIRLRKILLCHNIITPSLRIFEVLEVRNLRLEFRMSPIYSGTLNASITKHKHFGRTARFSGIELSA